MNIRWIIRPVLVVAAIIVLGSGILYLGSGAAYILVWPKEQTLDRLWSETWTALTSIPPDSIATRFPKTEANNSALKLEKLIAGIGIRPVPHRASPTQIASEAAGFFFKEGEPFLEAQLQRTDNRIEPPPSRVQSFLAAHQRDLKAIKALLLNQQPPHWEMDISQNLTVSLLPNASYPVPVAVPRFFNPEIPRWEMDTNQPFDLPHRSILSLIGLQRVLAVDILEKSRLGQSREALDMLEVSWQINSALRARPDHATMIALYVFHLQSLILRKMEGVPAEWQQRLGDHDYRQSYLLALEGTSWFLYRRARRASFEQLFGPRRDPAPVFKTPLGKPYLRFCAIDQAEKALATLAELRRQDTCSFDPRAFANKPELQPARWNTVGQFIIRLKDLAGSWRDIGWILLHRELTQKVLRIKQLRRTFADGSWPKQVPGLESSVCPGERWTYRVTPGGGMSISFSRQVPGQNGFPPLIHVESAR